MMTKWYRIAFETHTLFHARTETIGDSVCAPYGSVCVYVSSGIEIFAIVITAQNCFLRAYSVELPTLHRARYRAKTKKILDNNFAPIEMDTRANKPSTSRHSKHLLPKNCTNISRGSYARSAVGFTYAFPLHFRVGFIRARAQETRRKRC